MKIQYILHADFELPGIIETWAKENAHEERYCRPFAGEKVPHPEEFDLLIVMGGPQSPLEIEKDPYLADEMALIQNAVYRKMPVLGFCLGAQLIGEALGGKTEKSPHKEVGVFPVHLNSEGKGDFYLKGVPSPSLVTHWHNDMPGLTLGSKVLAFSRGCPRQIVRYLPYVYGFQCHPEATRENIEMMIKHCPHDLHEGTFMQSTEEFLASDFEGINQMMIRFMDRFASLHCNSLIES